MPSPNAHPKNYKDNPLDDAYRIIDANFNRTKEGMRVCEEICRFYLKDKQITKKLRDLRHRLTTIIKISDIDKIKLFSKRDSRNDLGRQFSGKTTSKSLKGIFMANAQRTKEALRVLEEFIKLLDSKQSRKIQKIRFDFYDLEKKTVQRFPALLDSR